MTASTPDQMRALAQRNEWTAREPGLHLESAAALRAAADQLEAVERWLWMHNHYLLGDAIDDLSAILTADTAPQEDR